MDGALNHDLYQWHHGKTLELALRNKAEIPNKKHRRFGNYESTCFSVVWCQRKGGKLAPQVIIFAKVPIFTHPDIARLIPTCHRKSPWDHLSTDSLGKHRELALAGDGLGCLFLGSCFWDWKIEVGISFGKFARHLLDFQGGLGLHSSQYSIIHNAH